MKTPYQPKKPDAFGSKREDKKCRKQLNQGWGATDAFHLSSHTK